MVALCNRILGRTCCASGGAPGYGRIRHAGRAAHCYEWKDFHAFENEKGNSFITLSSLWSLNNNHNCLFHFRLKLSDHNYSMFNK